MSGQSSLVFVGTYTNIPWNATQKGQGIYTYQLSSKDGGLSLVEVATEVMNPSFLAIDPTHHYLYAVNEVVNFNGLHGGGASAFALDAQTGKLTLLNSQSTRGAGSCYVSIDHATKWLLVSNYNDGNACTLPILEDGKLGAVAGFVQHEGSSIHPQRQQAAYAHSIIMDPGNTFALVADLGLDKIMIYRLDQANGWLTPNDTPWVKTRPGSGPRHMAFSTNERMLYIANELDSTVSVFDWDGANGTLKEIQTLPMLPENFTDESTAADIHLTPSGKFLYASNRGHDSLAIFAVDATSGLLTLLGHASTQGRTPRNFAIDPTGRILLAANQNSNSIVTFWIDAQTGKLTPTGQVTTVPAPVCAKII